MSQSTEHSTENVTKILLAEDNPADQRLISEALKRAGLNPSVQLVKDGEAALCAAQMAGRDEVPCPDLFILDLHMPRVDGHEVLRAFRANEYCRHTPVVVLTSLASPSDWQFVESFNQVRMLTKPTDLDEFLRVGMIIKSVLLPGQASA
jgi:CheY-like chemotaxis protein